METIKLLICKSKKGTMLLIGPHAKEEVKVEGKGVEYYEYDVSVVFGTPYLAAFELRQEYRLGMEASKKGGKLNEI